jgi:hypothetical protein
MKYILELNNIHSMNLGEDFEFVAMFVKGKNKNFKWDDLRPIFKGLKTDKEIMWFSSTQRDDVVKNKLMIRARLPYNTPMKNTPNNNAFINSPFGGAEFYTEDIKSLKKINNKHYKLKNYNYYYLDNDANKVNLMFEGWKKTNPMVTIDDEPVSCHVRISNLSGYTWAYKFNGKYY